MEATADDAGGNGASVNNRMTAATPEAIAAQALGVDAASITHVERIKHGLTNVSWRVRTASEAVVVRISNTAEQALQIDRESEAIVLRLVANAGLAPEVLVCQPGQHLLVTRDAGATWLPEQACILDNIRRVGKLLSRLHLLAAPPEIRRVDLIATVRGYLDVLDAHGLASEVSKPSKRQRAAEAASAVQRGVGECLCHNDVHSLNIVDDGALRLIDWEYSGIGERLFDLASICVYHRYGKTQREALLHAYLDEPAGDALRRLDLACWLFEYVRELWLEVRAATE
jgi:thiamine kinase-like enzyme